MSSIKQFTKFVVVGTAGAVVDFSVYNILTRGLGWHTVYLVFGYQIIAANVISVFLAILCNFVFNKYWTFRDPSHAVMRQGLGYFVLNSFTFILNQLLTSFFVFRVPLTAGLFGAQKDNAAKAAAIGVILFINFLGSKFLVFRRKAV